MGKSFVVGVLALDSYLCIVFYQLVGLAIKVEMVGMGVNKAAGIAVALWIFSFVPDAAKIFPVCLLNDRHRPLVETKIWSLDNLME